MPEREFAPDPSPAESADPLEERGGRRAPSLRRGPKPPDGEQLGALLGSLQPRLQSVALKITRDPEFARDAVQGAFEKAIRHRDRFRGESRFSTWIHRIVVNEALLSLRNQRRRREVIGDCGERATDEATDAAEKLLAVERSNLLQRGLERLCFADRAVVEHCGLSGWSYADYSAHTGLPVAAVKSRAFRARSRLRVLLEGS